MTPPSYRRRGLFARLLGRSPPRSSGSLARQKSFDRPLSALYPGGAERAERSVDESRYALEGGNFREGLLCRLRSASEIRRYHRHAYCNRRDLYNEVRPHGSLNYLTPTELKQHHPSTPSPATRATFQE